MPGSDGNPVLFCNYSQPNRALAARLRPNEFRLKWVLPIAEGDLIGKTRYIHGLGGRE
jgi:hypothetical protein